jgi:hypothetical protein
MNGPIRIISVFRESGMSLFKSAAVSGLALAALTASAPAAALVTFGSTIALSNNNVRYVNSTVTGTPSQLYSTSSISSTSASPASIFFGATEALLGGLPLNAASTFFLNATVPNPTGLSGAFDVTGVNGSFSILSNAPITIGSITSQVLLTAVFTNATFSGVVGSPAITLSGDNTTGTVTYSSDFLDFSQVVDAAFSFTGSSNENLQVGPLGRIRSFRGTVTGNFASDPVPKVLVPEPETWAMLVLGFGLVGVSVRRRRKVVLA